MILYELTGGRGPKTWTYAELGELTFAQLRNERNRGRRDGGGATMSGKDMRRVLDEFKAGKWK